jgi:general secretion pathway protein A
MRTATPSLIGVLSAAREPEFPMHEDYFGFAEKPFSLTPDPKYLYRSASHGSAFELLQYAIRRREGFVVITGDIGTGKTTLCRAVLDQLDRRTFTALVLNPFLSEEDLLRVILQDFGVVSREELKRGRLVGVSKQELIETLNDFLLSLQPIGAGALLIIDEAQNLPLQTLEQIRILSNLETDKEKLLQIVLVGQPNLRDLLKSPALRQLDQRVSIRFELNPLSIDETAAYVGHRLTVAGGGSAVTFTARALSTVYRYTGGTPRLINLLCDRALLGAFAQRTNRITHQIVRAAAGSLELAPLSGWTWMTRRPRWALLAGAAAIAIASTAAYAAIGQPRRALPSPAQVESAPLTAQKETPAATTSAPDLKAADAPSVPPSVTATTGATATQVAAARGATYSIVVGSFRHRAEAESLSTYLSKLGVSDGAVRIRLITAASGTWHQVLTGPYIDATIADREFQRVRQMPGYGDARLIIH